LVLLGAKVVPEAANVQASVILRSAVELAPTSPGLSSSLRSRGCRQGIIDTALATTTVTFAALLGAIAWNLITWASGCRPARRMR
jgi:hypothetical protein